MKKFIALFLCILVLSGMCGCGNRPEEELFLIGVLQPNLTATYQLELKSDIEAAVAGQKNLKCIFADAGNNVEKQIADIENMVSRKVDVIIISACNEQLVSDALKKAVESGIKVIVLGYAPYDSDAYTLQLFVNNYKIGYMAGEYACAVLDGKGVILEVQEDPSQRTTQERKKGFLAAIAESPGLVKEYVVAGYGTKDNASYALETCEILKPGMQIDFVFSHNNEMAEGAYTVLRENEIFPIIVGAGCHPESTEMKGIDASINYETLGAEAVTYALKLLNGEKYEKSVEIDPILYMEEQDAAK